MGNGSIDFTHKELRRAPGRRGGCSCCGFTFVGLTALPVLAIALLFIVF